MSKKTKQQKILADLRRQNFLLQQLANVKKDTPVSRPEVEASPSMNSRSTRQNLSENVHQKESIYIYPIQLIRKDLTKTLLLSILAISFEIALFLILEKHLVLPFGIKP